ncbi:hypothetical protein CLAFUW4_11261 [Fulvia fulva]|uniref:Uncharacterized protein n=1 Tax=Passalora fulva TaxID=5499 RepID=A0A9Q8PCY0_PASFU|nr:uncharacterized protein CLAFUR5_10304 [Fulvia fulva]KAK4619997.1 hypothetical protein CLAFUR4_11267 [Fulvia fulva]KAK4621115.1 hypothetical protein CLAFUR0_11272 [Fulvia fulva]UJO20135.1 hypothetical protein CLAFUR5_10304 [Fulvia fulva]WPV16993.1 hypothetical protein CLAFUW4_11261 [Fulvia fulva]WPV32450.1 hypothetical protein CLAFUW7_11257 [Fulvia fulva]
MTSHLRIQSSYGPVPAKAVYQTTSPSLPPAKKQKMSLTQTYYVASTARTKLGREAQRSDHNLRLLVGHANLLDTLMVELADAEREQEAWFNQSVKTASKPQERHVQWIDSIAEEDDEEDSDMDSDDGSELYDEDEEIEMFNIPLRKMRSPPVEITSQEIELDAEYEDDDFDDELTLTRVASQHSPPASHCPSLIEDSDSESDDESMPASPEQPTFELSEKEREAITTTAFYDIKSQQGIEDYIMSQPQQPLVAAC